MSDNNSKMMGILGAVALGIGATVSLLGSVSVRERVARVETRLENIDETLIDVRADVRKLVEAQIYKPQRDANR